MHRPFFLMSLVAAASVVLTSAYAADAPPTPVAVANADNVLRLGSANSFDDTVAKLKTDLATKGIRFFDAIDQAELAKDAGLELRRSTLVLFGNPPLGVQFLQSNLYSGLDWPVRMLVVEDASGNVWVAWTDFGAIAHRYRIEDRDAQFKMASEVAASIATAATQ